MKKAGLLASFSIIAILTMLVVGFAFILLRPSPNRIEEEDEKPQFKRFETCYFTAEMDSYLRCLWIGNFQAAAAYGVFSLEETHMGKWSLERFDKMAVVNTTDYYDVQTWSHLYTQQIYKHWRFWRNKPLIELCIYRIYVLDSWVTNNQIIVDVANQGITSNLNGSSIRYGCTYPAANGSYVSFQCGNATFTFTVAASSHPIAIEIPNPKCEWPTEVQINFPGCDDRGVVWHDKGDMEMLKVEIRVGGSNE